jgi:HK97 family phage major capsid protein
MRYGIQTPALKAAMNEGTASQGGYAVPTQYSNELVTPLTNLSYLRRAGARIINFSGTNAVDVPSLTFTSAAVLTSEASSYDEAEPTMGHVTFHPYKFTRIAKASEELAADSRFDLWGQILMPDFAQAFAAAENSYFTTGSGSSQPQGIMTGTSTGVTSASATAITADELISTFFALDYKYRANAKWMMNDATLAYVRKLKDGASRYLWEPGLNGDTQGLLLGAPVITNNSMDTIQASKDVILFGDFSYFWIGVWPSLSLQRLNELYAANGQLGFRSFSRVDSHVMLSAGFTKLTTHS